MIDFVRSCKENNIKPIGGMEFRDGDKLLFTGIAINNKGFKEINDYMSAINLKEETHSSSAPKFNNVYVIYPFTKSENHDLRHNEFIGIKPSQVHKLIFLSSKRLAKIVIQQPITFSDNRTWYLHKNLRAIDHNILLSHLELHMHAPNDETFISETEIANSFRAIPSNYQKH